MARKQFWLLIGGFGLLAALSGCGGEGGGDTAANNLVTYSLDANASGVIETRNNILNMTVVSKDANDLKAEYRAGFVQGKLQGGTIAAARDNTWDNSYLTDPSHSFPQQPGPTQAELQKAASILAINYGAFLQYLKSPTTDPVVAARLKRLLFRMLGIYHGATLEAPQGLDFSGAWLPDGSYLTPTELTLGYETAKPSFMDVYFINAYNDLTYVISYSPEFGGPLPGERPDKCSAFVKRTGNDIILTHNSWMGFLSQSMTQTLAVNGDLITMNTATPGQIGSATDFGYNNKGMMFNETTHRLQHSNTNASGLWIFWRASLAEQFATSITDFFDAISLDNSGTYLNGYMLVDVKNSETGLVEMSDRCFVFYRSTGGPYSVTAKATDGGACSTDYDPEMVTPSYLMGINYPASYQVVQDLGSTDNRPARRQQFKMLLPGVTNVEQAKAVITYTDPANPLSIFGRWDLGYGETPYPKQIPDGSVDAKVGSTGMVRDFMALSGTLDVSSSGLGFWMLFGTPKVAGQPFVWSRSSWSWQKLRNVPDRVDGVFTQMPLYLR
jgi:hypothetical protein